jgi:hypothetical protein
MNKIKIVTYIVAVAASIVTVGVLLGTTPAKAGTYTGLEEELCMADAYLLESGNSLSQGALNCTANDVEITQVIPVNEDEECTPGEIFTFPADVTIKTNANERWDPTFYLPLTAQSPQVVQGGDPNCSIVLPIPDGEGGVANANLDGDQCSDITKALGPDEYTLLNEPITMLCTPDPDDPTRALFTYCAAWDNQERDNCTVAADPYPGQIPNTKSKCKCDDFPINVFIRPPAPDILKTLTSTNTHSEPGGDYTFTLGFTNPSATSSIFISGLTDEVDDNQDGSYETSLDLWGSPQVPSGDGVYLTATTCAVGAPLYEVGPGASYTCMITVHIVDTDLPDDQSPEFYDDVIKFVLEDKNGAPVTNGDTCPAGLLPVDGDHCSPIRTVNVTNLPPTITVTKTPSTDEVLEPGGNVTFDVVVTSTAGSYDDPLTITSLMDSDFGDLTLYPGSTCATGGDLFLGAPYSCSFTAFISGNAGDVHMNTVTAKAEDNEGDEATNTDGATVNINDVPSLIRLEKTADPIQVDETGDDPTVFRDVDYTFEFCVDATGVDDVTFTSLTDDKFGTLTGDCSVDMVNGAPITPEALNGFVLSPGDCASCVITGELQGNAGDVHTNVATINGTDEDGQPVSDSDDATVTFLDTGLDITEEYAVKATILVRLTNGNVDTAEITAVTFKGTNLVAGAGSIVDGFEILNEAAGSSYEAGDGPYAFCSTGVFILPGDRYDCAFTVKLYPGFDPGDISLLATGANGLVFTLEDDENNPVNTGMEISIQTNEP